jgi:phage protein U
MAGIMMSFGPIRFGLNRAAYSDLKRKSEYRWPVLERLGRRPAHQFVGIGVDTINLKGTIYPSFDPGGRCVGIHRVDEMRAVAAQGIPYDLVSGYGEAFGRWVIKSIEEKEEVFFEDGSFRKQDFEMEISLYGEENSGLDGIVFMGGSIMVPRLQLNSSLNVGSLGLNVTGTLNIGG